MSGRYAPHHARQRKRSQRNGAAQAKRAESDGRLSDRARGVRIHCAAAGAPIYCLLAFFALVCRCPTANLSIF
jgi:hypothetical protein